MEYSTSHNITVAPPVWAVCAVMILFLAVACSGKRNPPTIPESRADVEVSGYSGPVWPALALLQTGENPLWFELGPNGPSLIESPAAASLTPYAPWPYARFVSGIQVWDGFLVMAVNRDGFLVLGASVDSTVADSAAAMLYRVSGDGLWDPYTVESFFIWDAKPAVLLYRNDFFVEPSAPSLKPQVYVLDRSSAGPLGAAVRALERFPSDGPWETEVVRRGPDDLWYYRMKEKGKAQNETAYFRAGDLAAEGKKISVGEWRNSDLPEKPENTPPLLAAVLEKAATELGPVVAARTVSPDFEGTRFFSSAGIPVSAETENAALLYAFCRETPRPLALAVLSDGRGLYSFEPAQETRPFSLPALPEGFVYTGVALLGKVLTASWEEQQEAGIGAAGFMTIKFTER